MQSRTSKIVHGMLVGEQGERLLAAGTGDEAHQHEVAVGVADLCVGAEGAAEVSKMSGQISWFRREVKLIARRCCAIKLYVWTSSLFPATSATTSNLKSCGELAEKMEKARGMDVRVGSNHLSKEPSFRNIQF